MTFRSAGLAVALSCALASPARAEPSPAPRTVEREAKSAAPVGGSFLGEGAGWQRRLPAATGEGPPLLFMLSRAQLASARWNWELPALGRAMAEELAAVLDQGCTSGCAAAAGHARERLRDLLDEPDHAEGAPRTKSWITDEDDTPTWHRRLGIRVSAGPLAVEVECTCNSDTVGMRVWNDITTCDATLLERGRTLARYLPRVELGDGKLSERFPLEAFSQTVRFPDGGELLIESGYDYVGDGKEGPYQKVAVRGRIVLQGKLIAP